MGEVEIKKPIQFNQPCSLGEPFSESLYRRLKIFTCGEFVLRRVRAIVYDREK